MNIKEPSQHSALALPRAERRFMHGWGWLCGHREREWKPLWRVRVVRTEEDTGYYSPGGRISRWASVLGALGNHPAMEVNHYLSLKGGTWVFPFQKGKIISLCQNIKWFQFFAPLAWWESKFAQILDKAWGYFFLKECSWRENGENNILHLTHSKEYMEICEEREIEMKL